MKPLIISDLDGTLVNIMDEVLEMIWHHFNIAVRPRDVQQYDVAAALFGYFPKNTFSAGQAGLATWLKENAWGNRWLYEVAKPYWDIQAAYHKAMSAADIAFCTGRPETEDVEEATLEWLSVWGYDTCDCYFASSYAGGKAGVVDEILDGDKRPLWIIEDDIEAAKMMEEIVLAVDWECRILIVDRPWTRVDYKGRYYGGCDVAKELEKLLGETAR